jgi:hypothetical protein
MAAGWLQRLLGRPGAPRNDDLRADVAQLSHRVRTLEAERLELLVEWTKTRDQVIRYMKRAGALRAAQVNADPLDDLDDRVDPELDRQLDLEVFRAKFGGR